MQKSFSKKLGFQRIGGTTETNTEISLNTFVTEVVNQFSHEELRQIGWWFLSGEQISPELMDKMLTVFVCDTEEQVLEYLDSYFEVFMAVFSLQSN